MAGIIQAPLVATTSMGATVITFGNTLSLTMPVPELLMTGIAEQSALSLSLPVPRLSIYGLTGAIGQLALTMPMPTLYMAQGGSLVLTMPAPILQMTGLNGAVGRILLRGALPSIEMAGHLNEIGVLTLTLHPPNLLMTGKESEIASLALTLKPPKILMYGLSGVVGSLSLQLKMPSLLMTGYIEARGNLVLTMPVPFLSMTGDQFFAARYIKGLVMNMSHFAVSDYVGYEFNSLAYFNGKFMGGNGHGIFAFGGSKDNGRQINSRAKLPVLDSYEAILKKARDAWLTCRTDGQMMLIVQLGEGEYYDDIFERTGKAHEDRCKLPKGIKERFLSFELKNVDGSDFDIDKLRFTIDAVQRRKR